MRLLLLLKTILLSATVRPLSHFWPKDPHVVAFMPQEGQRFTDNVAHLFESLRVSGDLPEGAYLLMSGPRQVTQELRKKEKPAFSFVASNPRELLRYLRTSVVIADHWHWASDGRFSCFAGARKVQIWHGIPLKRIELNNMEGRRSTRGIRGTFTQILHWLKGRHPLYDLVVATSPFFLERAFGSSFRAKRFAITGYPRNDYLLNADSSKIMVDMDHAILKRLAMAKTRGDRLLLYAPTFRDHGDTPFEDGALHRERLELFAKENSLTIIVKLHPYLHVPESESESESSRVLFYNPHMDVAPLLKLADLLITDYSSTFFDFLLLDRPIIFFSYDLERYFARDRQFLFPYDEFTPGVKVNTEVALFEKILEELERPDEGQRLARQRMRDKSFQFIDAQASARLWTEVKSLLTP